MKGKKTYFLLLGFYFFLLVLIGMFSPHEVSWIKTYSSRDKIPFGNYVLFKELHNIFPGKSIAKVDTPFYNFFKKSHAGYKNYILITDELKADLLDVESMLKYVELGNNIFIASQDIPKTLEDSLGILLVRHFHQNLFSNGNDSVVFVSSSLSKGGTRKTTTRFRATYTSTEIKPSDSIASAFVTTILGKDQNGNTNFVRATRGKGNFFLHTLPTAFTNYHLLKKENTEYISGCLSYLPVKNTTWDEYYKPAKPQKATTPLRFVLSVPAYKWAYYVGLASLLIYVVFGLKREQRIIPIVEPPKNLSLEFAQTVGTLYYRHRDYRDLAEKKMVYFLEKIRHHYFLQTQKTDEAFFERLASKSNTDIDLVKTIFRTYIDLRERGSAGEDELIAFHRALETFYKQTGLNNK